MKDQTNNRDDERRESGLPGGGQGRRDEVGGSGIYPVSGDKMPADNQTYIRTAGELGQRGRGLQGYNDSGSSEAEAVPDVDQNDNSPTRQAGQPHGEETAASYTVDPDNSANARHPERF